MLGRGNGVVDGVADGSGEEMRTLWGIFTPVSEYGCGSEAGGGRCARSSAGEGKKRERGAWFGGGRR